MQLWVYREIYIFSYHKIIHRHNLKGHRIEDDSSMTKQHHQLEASEIQLKNFEVNLQKNVLKIVNFSGVLCVFFQTTWLTPPL